MTGQGVTAESVTAGGADNTTVPVDREMLVETIGRAMHPLCWIDRPEFLESAVRRATDAVLALLQQSLHAEHAMRRPDGSLFPCSPKGAALLAADGEQVLTRLVGDWTAHETDSTGKDSA